MNGFCGLLAHGFLMSASVTRENRQRLLALLREAEERKEAVKQLFDSQPAGPAPVPEEATAPESFLH